jgi:hypothetical protein
VARRCCWKDVGSNKVKPIRKSGACSILATTTPVVAAESEEREE